MHARSGRYQGWSSARHQVLLCTLTPEPYACMDPTRAVQDCLLALGHTVLDLAHPTPARGFRESAGSQTCLAAPVPAHRSRPCHAALTVEPCSKSGTPHWHQKHTIGLGAQSPELHIGSEAVNCSRASVGSQTSTQIQCQCAGLVFTTHFQCHVMKVCRFGASTWPIIPSTFPQLQRLQTLVTYLYSRFFPSSSGFRDRVCTIYRGHAICLRIWYINKCTV